MLRKGDEGAAPRSNYSLAVRLLSTMVVYNPILLLQLCEGRALIDELLQIFSNIDSVKTYEGKRVFVLAFAQLLDLSASGKLPGPLQSHTADVVRAIANQLKKAIDLRKKNDEDGIEDDSDDDDDSEQDIDEDEDASNQIQANLSEVIRQAVANEENESDDDYFDQECVK